jgi:hypothetical protein
MWLFSGLRARAVSLRPGAGGAGARCAPDDQETGKMEQKETEAKRGKRLREIFGSHFQQRTFVLTALLTCSIIGWWAGAVYAPAALTQLAAKASYTAPPVAKFKEKHVEGPHTTLSRPLRHWA